MLNICFFVDQLRHLIICNLLSYYTIWKPRVSKLFMLLWLIYSYAHYAISVRTASVISIESARVARSYKNDPHHWRQLCIEGNYRKSSILPIPKYDSKSPTFTHSRTLRSDQHGSVGVRCGHFRANQIRVFHLLATAEGYERSQFDLRVWATVHTGGFGALNHVMIAAIGDPICCCSLWRLTCAFRCNSPDCWWRRWASKDWSLYY